MQDRLSRLDHRALKSAAAASMDIDVEGSVRPRASQSQKTPDSPS
jgi:hypothetical protein